MGRHYKNKEMEVQSCIRDPPRDDWCYLDTDTPEPYGEVTQGSLSLA